MPGADAARALPASELTTVAQPHPSETDQLFRKLVWSTLFRLITITVLLGGTALVAWTTPGFMGAEAASLFRIVLCTYVVSLGSSIALRRRVALQVLAYGQIALDVALAAVVVSLTGSAESVFVFMFLLGIVNGAVLLFRRGAVAAAAASLLVYLPLVTLRVGSRPHAPTLFVHAIAFITTAALASYLAEQLRRTGEKLEEREVDLAAITALHESIVQSLASGLVTVDEGGKITFLNRAGEQITGLQLAQVRHEPADRWFGAFLPVSGRDETDFENVRGERLRLGYTVFPLHTRGGSELGRAVIFQDLTQLRAMEARVQRSERLADLGQVAAGLAHELRNPLASMAGSIELLKGAPGLREADTRLMDIVLREAGRLEQLVASFLAFARPAPPRREKVRLDLVLSDTLEVFRHDPFVARVHVESDLSPTSAWCDADQMKQVLWNLLANAAQAAGGGEAQGTVRVACGEEAEAARLVVQDDGPGITSTDMHRLFTPFFTTKQRGSGLGLATVQRIVDANGGTVVVESKPGEGARFVVRLPSCPPGEAG